MRTKCIVWLTLCWLAGSACGPDFGDKTSGQACTRSSQCARGLLCREGACHPLKKKPAMAPEADAGAMGADADAEVDESTADLRGM